MDCLFTRQNESNYLAIYLYVEMWIHILFKDTRAKLHQPGFELVPLILCAAIRYITHVESEDLYGIIEYLTIAVIFRRKFSK